MTNNPTANHTTANDTTGTNRPWLRRALPVSVLGLGLAVGVGAVLATPSIASAQDDGSTTDDPTIVAEAPPFGDFLAPLVEDGTITQEQADAIAASLGNHLGDGGFGRHSRSGGHGNFDSTVVTDLLGITQQELAAEHQAGNSLATVAEAQGVDPQTVIDALVAEKQAQLDQAVADGNLTAEEAATRAENIVTRVTDRVNGVGEGPRGPRPRPAAAQEAIDAADA